MSVRSLIEVNHDFADRMDEGFLPALQRYLCSASGKHAEALARYGVNVIGMRHHAGQYYVEREPDGFPVKVFPKPGQPA